MPVWAPLLVFGVVLALIVATIAIQVTGDGSRSLGLGSDDSPGDGFPDTPEEIISDEQVPSEYGGFEDPADPAAPATKRLQFSGSGEATLPEFTMEQGLIRVTMTYEASPTPKGYFAVRFVRTDEAQTTNPFVGAPDLQSYQGSRYVGLAAGTYELKIDGDGSWLVELEFPTADDATTGPRAEGTGHGAPAPAALVGDWHEITFRHFGQDTFQVTVYDWRGNSLEPSRCSASGFGAYDQTKTCDIPGDGPYFFDVQADGRWEILF